MIRRCFLRIYGCNRGVTAIEFAFLAPIMFLLLFATIEFGLILYMRSGIEAATHDAARYAITGQKYGTNQNKDAGLRKLLEEKLNLYMIVKQDYTIKSEIYGSISQLSGSASNKGVAVKFGGSDDIVKYTVTMDYKYLTPLGYFIGLTAGQTRIQSVVFVKNEGY